jgi:hypothetical protein
MWGHHGPSTSKHLHVTITIKNGICICIYIYIYIHIHIHIHIYIYTYTIIYIYIYIYMSISVCISTCVYLCIMILCNHVKEFLNVSARYYLLLQLLVSQPPCPSTNHGHVFNWDLLQNVETIRPRALSFPGILQRQSWNNVPVWPQETENEVFIDIFVLPCLKRK